MHIKKPIYGKIYLMTKDDDDNIIDTNYFYPIFDENIAKAIQKTSLIWKNEDRKYFDNDDVYFLHNNWKEGTCLFILEDEIPLIKNMSRGVATCAYSATNEYIQVMLGGKLSREDENWYRNNSLITSDGLPQENTFTVIQQLVEPYNIGISEIVVPRHSRRFDSYMPFIQSLGCNPFFIVDGCTTNEEALTLMFPNEEERNKMRDIMFSQWKFHCEDKPLQGSIYMKQFQMKALGHNGGSTFRSVRSLFDPNEIWWMSIKLNRLNDIKYLTPLILPEYKEWSGQLIPDFRKIKDNSGKTLDDIIIENKKSYKKDSFFNIMSDNKSYSDKCQVCLCDPGILYYQDKKICENCGAEQKKKLSTFTNEDITNDKFLENFYKNGFGLLDD